MATFISVADVTVGEKDGFADFVVTLDAPNVAAVTVNYQTFNGTAVGGSDVTGTSGLLTFAPGETLKTVRVTVLNDAVVEPTENFGFQLFSPSANATIARNIATGTIIDNDAPSGTPVISINDFVIDEAAKEATFVITLDRPSVGVVSMSYATQNGTALAGADYVAASGTLSFAAGETAKTVKVSLLNDATPESSEAFNLVLSGLVGGTTLDPVGTAIIGENDAPAVATSNLTVEDVTVGESQTYADFLVRLDTPNTTAVTVNYQTFNGTAVGGSDVVGQSGFLTFAAGETVKTVRVTLLNDTVAESIENFGFQLFSPSANATIARNVATATIIDNDAPSGTPVVSINDFVIDEAAKEATFVITLDRPSTSIVSMNYATQDGAALAGSDYVTTNGTLNFGPGETAKTIKVTLLNDTAPESSEAFNLVLSGLVGATTLDPVGTAIIGENDAVAVTNSNITVEDVTVGESQSYVDFLVRLDAPNTTKVTVNYQTFNGTAVGGSDVVGQSGFLTFAAGETVTTVRVTLLNDTVAEPTENFGFQLFSPSANATIARNIATATVIDNDTPSGTPVASINDFVIDEGAKEATFVITLDRPSTGIVSLNYATQNGTALAGSDYVTISGALNFGPGETAKTVKVTLLNDTTPESSEAFNLVLSGLIGATTLDPVGTAVIGENDAPAVLKSNLSVEDITVGESQTYADFLVRLDTPNTTAVTVNYQTFNGTAVGGSDVVGQSGFLTFAAGEMVKTVRVTLLNDAVAEPIENFGFQLFSASANATIARNIATATIIDNDAPSGTPVVSINDFVIDEAAKEATFVITLDRPSTGVVSMNYAAQNGNALSGSDYVAASGKVSFAPGETAKTVTVTLLNDTTAESAEAFNLVLSSIVGATSLDPTGTAIIGENDSTAILSSNITVDNVTVGEGQTYADFLVRLDTPNTTAVTVNYQTFNGTAVGGSDVVGQSGFLTFAAGETVKTVRVTLLNDTVAESIENFGFQLFSPSANATIARNIATGTIIDNDAPSGTPIVSLSDAVVDENDGLAYVTVSLNKPSAGGVKVNCSVQDVTAVSGSDYVSFPALTVSFAAGETAKRVAVGLLDDTNAESSEVFDVTITSVTGATIGDGRGHVVIASNDGAAVATSTISVANITAVENDGFADFQVRLSAPNTGKVTVNYQTFNGTAVGGSDVVGQSGFLTFAAGETVKTVRVTLINDAVAEPIENFGFQIFSPSANAVIGNATATATIIDDDSPPPAVPIAIAGTVGPDTLHGTKFADAMTGNNGNDVLDGAAGNDSMNGGAGDDIYIVEQTGDTVIEAAGGGNDVVLGYVNYTLSANVEELTLLGAALNGTGNTGNNILRGNAGNNILDGGPGADTMIGGLGNDTYVVDNVGDVVTELASGGTDTVQSSISYILSAQLENLTLTGAAAINGTGNALANIMSGNSGNNILDGSTGTDTVSYANATAGVNVSLAIAGAQNTVGAGTDTLLNFENLTGSNFADTLTGNANANVINGGTGIDTMIGGGSNDTYIVDNTGDVVTEAALGGTDLVQSSATYTLGVEVENLTLTGAVASNGTGNGLDNILTGNTGANTLDGQGGNDKLLGGTGNDRLVGAAGNDTLTGGTGLDKFVFNAPLNAATNVDSVTDFTVGQDTIVLGKAIFTALNVVNLPLDPTQFFSAAGATAGADASDRIVYNSTTGDLYYDADGAGGSAATLFAKLTTHPAITAASIFVEP